MGVEGRKIQWFLNTFAACLFSVSFVRNVKLFAVHKTAAVHYVPGSYTGKSRVHDSVGTVHPNRITALQVIHIIVTDWQHVPQ
jgi:hypothetical protein